MLADVYRGRNMHGVTPGSIKKLLVLETLPKPMNYTGGMEPLSYGGTFTLERVLGTIPVESDGSACATVPAMRSLFFVALDEQDLSVKRMQSFMTVMPGETVTCIGCHESRTEAPSYQMPQLEAVRRAPSIMEPFSDVPDVFDFPRDVQPILDRHCVACHDTPRREGGLILAGDHGPVFSLSYYALIARDLISDGRNGMGNRLPRSIGSSASRLLRYLRGDHYNAQLTEREQRIVRLWLDSGAPYPGTYRRSAPAWSAVSKSPIVQSAWTDRIWHGQVFSEPWRPCSAGVSSVTMNISPCPCRRPTWLDPAAGALLLTALRPGSISLRTTYGVVGRAICSIT